MAPNPTNGPIVPSRNALRVLRRLALAGSTVGGFCTLAAITYDVNRRIRVAENIIENKRALQTSAPNYDATYAARRMARMMAAAEAGEFTGMESWKEQDMNSWKSGTVPAEGVTGEMHSHAGVESSEPARAESFLELIGSSSVDSLENKRRQEELGRRNPENLARHLWESKPGPPQISEQPASSNKSEDSTSDTQKEISIPDQLQQLLETDRPIDAAQVFLEAHPPSVKWLSSERRELAEKIFYTNSKEGNVFVARNIFERLEEVDRISLEMWEAIMFALAKNGSIESVATIYSRYRYKFRPSPNMVDVILRCLLEAHRLTTAKWLLFRNLHIDRNCGLCGVYLTGLWKKTRSIELMNGQLKKILQTLARLGKDPSYKLFNPVVKAYIDFGRFADAEALVQDMIDKYQIPLQPRTKGLLLYGKALRCDWEGVEEGLQEMYDTGTARPAFLAVFDRIFLEYWVSHTGTEIRDFVFKCIDKYGIVPDRCLYKHMLEAFVEKGDKDMVAKLTSKAREKRWKVTIKEKEFLEILRSRRHALEMAPVGLWKMLQAARMKYGQAATSRQIMGYDQQSFPLDEVNKMPFTEAALEWHERGLDDALSSKPVDQYQKLHKQMSHYIHAGKMTEALKCYNGAKIARFEMKQLHVELAAIANFVEYGVTATRAFVEEESRRIRHHYRFFPIFFHQIMQMAPESEGEMLKLVVLRFYELCNTSKNLTVKHHLTIGTCRRLIAQGKPELAVDLLSAVYTSRYRNSADFDGVCMKLFVRAFSESYNFQGIRWCILTGISRPDEAVNQDFVVEVRRIIGVLSRKIRSFKDATNRAEQLEYLDCIADLLGRKSAGDPSLLDLRPDPIKKRLARRRLKQPPGESFKQSKIRQAIEWWDEEYELEAALGRLDTNTASISAQWDESQSMGETWPMKA